MRRLQSVEVGRDVTGFLEAEPYVGHAGLRNEGRRVLQKGDEHVGLVGQLASDEPSLGHADKWGADDAGRRVDAGNGMTRRAAILAGSDQGSTSGRIAIRYLHPVGNCGTGKIARREAETPQGE
jgi:hypothetical protein